MARRDHDDEGVDIPMTPMIDCVFLLLIFFLVTWQVNPHRELELKLPHASAAKTVKDDRPSLVVAIDNSGQWYIDSAQLNKTKFNQRISDAVNEALEEGGELPRVRIDCERNVPFSKLVEVINVLQIYNLNDIGFKSDERVGDGR